MDDPHGGDRLPQVELGRFSEGELAAAWDKWRGVARTQGRRLEARIPDELADLLREPLLFRSFAKSAELRAAHDRRSSAASLSREEILPERFGFPDSGEETEHPRELLLTLGEGRIPYGWMGAAVAASGCCR